MTNGTQKSLWGYYIKNFDKENVKKYLASRGFEPGTACMLSRRATPRPRGKVDFTQKNILTGWSLEIWFFHNNPVDPPN